MHCPYFLLSYQCINVSYNTRACPYVSDILIPALAPDDYSDSYTTTQISCENYMSTIVAQLGYHKPISPTQLLPYRDSNNRDLFLTLLAMSEAWY